ncbi:MAG: hypothetical protein SGCHY_000043 [Lobulomycetales sp.]
MLRRLPLLGAGVLALWLVLHSSTLRASESVVVHEETCAAFFDQRDFSRRTHLVQSSSEALFPDYKQETPYIPDLIHFLSYNSNLRTARYICSLESALTMNPGHLVYIYTPDPEKMALELSQWLFRMPLAEKNLVIIKIDYAAYFQGTPMQAWYKEKLHEKSWWVDQNLGNAFRLAILWKLGGTYLDMDIISVNPLTWTTLDGKFVPMGRFIAREEPEQLNNAALRFPKNDPMVWQLMQNFVDKFDGYKWANNGPFCITQVFKENCSQRITMERQSSLANDFCSNLDILSISRFYPIHYRNTKIMGSRYQEHCGLLKDISMNGLGLHWWHKSMENDERKSNKTQSDSVFGALFQVKCPKVVEAFGWKGLGFEDVSQ